MSSSDDFDEELTTMSYRAVGTGLPVAEYAANLIKKTVVGVGHAEKRQVAMMVRMLLPASTARTPDAAAALAVAICHAQHRAARARGAA